jgi:C-1 hydroxylase
MASVTRLDLQPIVERQLEAWRRRDVAAILGFHAPDGVVESPMYGTRRGLAEIEEAYRAFFKSFPDVTFVAETILIDPPNVAVFVDVDATHRAEFFGLPGTNRHIDMRLARAMLFDDNGLIAHERRIYDFTGLLLQVGVLRAKPGKS